MAIQSVRVTEFDSVSALVKRAQEVHETVPADFRASTGTNGLGPEWFGSETFDQALDWGRWGGWEPETTGGVDLESLAVSLEPIMADYLSDPLVLGPSVCGSQIDMAAHVEGFPEDMRGWIPGDETVHDHVVRMVIGGATGARNSGEMVALAGVAMAILVRLVRLAGYEMELWYDSTVASNRGADALNSVRVPLLRAGQVPDEGDLLYAVGSPAFHRRLVFAVCEGFPKTVRERFGFSTSGSYGNVRSPSLLDEWGEGQGYGLNRSEVCRELDAIYGSDEAKVTRWALATGVELGVLDLDGEQIDEICRGVS